MTIAQDRTFHRIAGNAAEELRHFAKRARARVVRSMREFAETELIIPDGDYAGLRFGCDRQPWTRLYLDAVDSGKWNRVMLLGPVQSGKTLTGYVIPAMHGLFELGETTIGGLPDKNIAGDKWHEDLLPAIERSKYAKHLPSRGSGSRGGKVVDSIQFGNGVTLKWMSKGGGDAMRSGFTARIVVITELDKMDTAGESSREADPVSQIEARTRHYGNRKRIFGECTVSIEEGRIWREYQNGTKSRIACLCPHCLEYVTPEREHLTGWREAKTEFEAHSIGAFACPTCSEKWTEADRYQANVRAVLLHGDQTIDRDGTIHGDPPASFTLGFRYSAVNNMFVSAGDLAAEEWRSALDPDEDNAERRMRQEFWAVPHEPEALDVSPLDARVLQNRCGPLRRGMLPAERGWLTVGIDIGKHICHWVATYWTATGRGYVVDYGVLITHPEDSSVEVAILTALREFRDTLLAGWGTGETHARPALVWIDSRYQEEAVYAFARESNALVAGNVFFATMGHAEGVEHSSAYRAPKKLDKSVRVIGDQFHIVKLVAQRVYRAAVNVDAWKWFIRGRLACGKESADALVLFATDGGAHFKFAKHLTAEKPVEVYKPGKGVIQQWERVNRDNHWLDATVLACAAAAFCGLKTTREVEASAETVRNRSENPPRMTTPDGRAFLASEREDR